VGILVWVFLKPLVYVLAFALLARELAELCPHATFRQRPLPTWLVVGLAAVARIALGVPGGLLAMYAVGDQRSLLLFALMVMPLGALLWFFCARLAFRKAHTSTLTAFALLAELVTGAIDTWAFDEVRSIRFC
jgi:hypothetical protein